MNKKTLNDFRTLISKFSFLKKYRGVTVRKPEDIGRVPFARRLEIQRFDISRAPEVPEVFYEATGGQGGKNFFLGISKASHEGMVRRAVQAMGLMGVEKGSRCLSLLFSDLVERGVIRYGGVLMGAGDVHSYKSLRLAHDALKELSITYVFACPNLLWDVLVPLGKRHTVKKCMVSGELLLPWFREYFQAATGIKLYNWYGSSGGFIAAQEDPADEYMRVLDQGLYLEVLDEKGVSRQTGTGTLVYTDLYNYSSPLIRYVLEDKVSVIQRGRHRYLKLFYRSGDHLKLDGELVYKGFLKEEIQKILRHNTFLVTVKKASDYQDALMVVLPEKSMRAEQLIGEFMFTSLGLRPKTRVLDKRLIARIVRETGNIVDCRGTGMRLPGDPGE